MKIVAINKKNKLAITDCNIACGVQTWIDSEGEETDDVDAAVCAVVPLPNGQWASVDLRNFENVKAH